MIAKWLHERLKSSDLFIAAILSPLPAGIIAWICVWPWGSANAPAWVQAVGSILALIGAAYLPIWHSNHVAKQRARNTLGQMRLLAEDCHKLMWKLSNLFLFANEESKAMRAYLRAGRDQDWGPIATALELIPTAEIPPQHLRSLGALRRAVQQGLHVVEKLPSWISNDSSHPEIVEELRSQRSQLKRIMSSIPWPADVPRDNPSYEYERGRKLEHVLRMKLFPMKIDSVKIYRRYGWGSGGEVPTQVDFQVVFPFEERHPDIVHVERGNPYYWKSFDEAEDVVRTLAQEQIQWIAGEWWGYPGNSNAHSAEP